MLWCNGRGRGDEHDGNEVNGDGDEVSDDNNTFALSQLTKHKS